ncbi:MAG: hypothetical protein K2O67_01980 [Clostridia bacterium]|nr:hypothetical protein [Clostridia bacterium]
MAKTKLKDYGSSRGRVVEERMNEAEMKSRRENQTAQMDAKMKELADKAIEFYDQYGADDYRYQMMVTFLDVAFQMKDAITLISSVQVATSYLSTAIQFIDDSILYEDQFNDQLLSRSYGFFARLKRKIIMRRAARNNRRRLETAIKNMTVRVEMAHEITESLRTGFEKMRETMARSDAKRMKKEAKRSAKTGVPMPDQKRALDYIAEVRGGKPSAPSNEPAAPSSAPATAPEAGGSTTRGIDDIID